MFTTDDMLRLADEAFGTVATAAVATWQDFNTRYFEGRLQPIPIVLTAALPLGRETAHCDYAFEQNGWRQGRAITLLIGRNRQAGKGDLLHSMIHQHAFEVLEQDPRHSGETWRTEIMRLHRIITGQRIWCGPSITVRTTKYRAARINKPDAAGQPSLSQGEIAAWPAGFIDLGPLV